MKLNLLEEHNYCKSKEFEFKFNNINCIHDNGIVAQDAQTLLELFEKVQANSNDILLTNFHCDSKNRGKYNKKSHITKTSGTKKISNKLLNKKKKIKISKPSIINLQNNLNASTNIATEKNISISPKFKTDNQLNTSNNNVKDNCHITLANTNSAYSNANLITLIDTSINNFVQNSSENKTSFLNNNANLLQIEKCNKKVTNNREINIVDSNSLSNSFNSIIYDSNISKTIIDNFNSTNYDINLINKLEYADILQISRNNISNKEKLDEINKKYFAAKISDNGESNFISSNKLPLDKFPKIHDLDSLKCDLKSPVQNTRYMSNARIISHGKGGHRKRRVIRQEANLFDKIPSYYTLFSRPPRGITKAASHTNIDWGQFTNNFDSLNCDNMSQKNSNHSVMDKIPNYHSCFTNSIKYSTTNDGKDIQSQPTLLNSNNFDLEISHNIDVGNYCKNAKPNETNFLHEKHNLIHYNTKNITNENNKYDAVSKLNEQKMKTKLKSESNNDDSLAIGDNLIRSVEIICDDNNNGVETDKILSTIDNNVSYNKHDDTGLVMVKQNTGLIGLEMLCDVALNHHSVTNNSQGNHLDKRKHELIKLEDNEIKRRIVYIGRIENELTKDQLRNMFQQFGSIIDCSVHFREYGENYGFVSFENAHSASLAVQESSKIDLLKNYDICFGGRRKFCKHEYFDLDGRQQLIEDLVPASSRRPQLQSFDELLKEAFVKIRTK